MSRGLGDVYKRQALSNASAMLATNFKAALFYSTIQIVEKVYHIKICDKN
nr:hypothetical protein [Elizabethkingia sp. ASV34]